MAYDEELADRVRIRLSEEPGIKVEEKKGFGGLLFLVNGKMCINISKDKLMCRYDQVREEEVAEKNGFRPLEMKGKAMPGFCYVEPEGYKTNKDFEYWINLCLSYNPEAPITRKKATAKKKK